MLSFSAILFPAILLLSAQDANAFAPSASSIMLQPSAHGYLNTAPSSIAPPRSTTTKLSALPIIDLDTITSISSSLSSSSLTTSTSLSPILSNENIMTAFNVATFGPQILWVFMILLPNTQITKKIMGGYAPIVAFSLVHLFIVIASASQDNGTAPLAEFNDVFDPSGNPQQAMMGMMKYPNFVSEEWSHVLTWDLFVGRMIWLDGLKRGIFTGHSVLFCNLIGPPGFLIHIATCLITGKGLVGNEAEELEDEVEK